MEAREHSKEQQNIKNRDGRASGWGRRRHRGRQEEGKLGERVLLIPSAERVLSLARIHIMRLSLGI